MQNPMHAVGGAADLPIPAWLAITGGCLALAISFAVLAFAWKNAKFSGPRPDLNSPPKLLQIGLSGLGLLLGGYFLWVVFFGPDLATNPSLGMFYIWLWVGVPLLSVCFGNWYHWFSPLQTCSRGLEKIGMTFSTYPQQLGYWPATLGLFAFVWQELVNPENGMTSNLKLWLTGYLAVQLIGLARYGDIWLRHADPFEVFATLSSRLSPLSWQTGIKLVNPLAKVSQTIVAPGLLACLAILVGSTGFDALKGQIRWLNLLEKSSLSSTWMNFFGLVSCCGLVYLLFFAATRFIGKSAPNLLALSLIPIILGYFSAHYLTYLVEGGQNTLKLFSDPLSNGSDWFGTKNLAPNYWLSQHPTLLASSKVFAIVVGHILAAVVAHDLSLTLLKQKKVVAQIPLLLVMVAFTGTGLWLLFGR